MTTALDVAMTVHTLFAALWTGGTLLVAGTVIPAARRELLGEKALSLITRRFSFFTIASVFLLLLSGGHLAGNLYTVETLSSTGRGHLVLTMVGLWFGLAVVLAFGFHRLRTIPSEQSAASAATKARPWFLAGSAISIALLLVAGVL